VCTSIIVERIFTLHIDHNRKIVKNIKLSSKLVVTF